VQNFDKSVSYFLGNGSIQIRPEEPENNIEQNRKKKGMVLPFPPLSIIFEDIKYSVDMPKVLAQWDSPLQTKN
jgi:hypothetical protein